MVGTDEKTTPSSPAFAPSPPPVEGDPATEGMTITEEDGGGGVEEQQEQQQPQPPQPQGKEDAPMNPAPQDDGQEKEEKEVEKEKEAEVEEDVVEVPEQQQQPEQTPSSPPSSPSPSPSPEDETPAPVTEKPVKEEEQKEEKQKEEVEAAEQQEEEEETPKTEADGEAATVEPSPSPSPTPSQQQRQAPAEVLDPLEIGEEVSTVWGVGVVKEMREGEAGREGGKEEGVYVVEAVGWKMADGKPPVMYLQRAHIDKMTPYVIYKWPTHKKLVRAIYCKEEGNRCFKNKDVVGAEKRYLDTIGVVQLMVDQELDNKQKAQKLEVLIPTLNNLGAARLKLEKHADACVVARTAYHLIDELEKRGPESLVLQEMLALGVTEEQLFRRYKRKAAFFAGKALMNVKEWKGAVVMLEAAREIDKLLDPVGKSVEAREAAALLVKARQGKQKEEKKEKAVWSKAFQLSSEEAAQEEAKTRRTTPTAAAAGPATSSSLPSSLPPSLGGASVRPPLPQGTAAAVAAAAVGGGGAGAKKKSRALEGGKKKGGKKGGREGGEEEGWWNEKTEYLTLLALGSAVLGGFAFFNYRNRK